MRVLVGCEESGIVAAAFRALGHEAWSSDLLPTRGDAAWHIQDDLLKYLRYGWDLGLFFPPCTHLAGSGARWLTDHWVTKKSHPDGRYWHDGSAKRAAQAEAVRFVNTLWEAPIERVSIENPVGMLSTLWRQPSQRFNPFNFGDPFRKNTCLWLRGLPLLTYTSDLTDGEQACWKEPPGPHRARKRSETYPGVARAMASQWGGPVQIQVAA